MRFGNAMLWVALSVVAVSLVGCPQAPKTTYRSTGAVDMLDESFYEGEAEDWSYLYGRQPYFARTSHDGKRIAFYGMNFAASGCAFFVVDVGAPDSYRRITPYYPYAPEWPIHWAPDDSALLVASNHVVIPPPGQIAYLEPLLIHDIFANDASVTSLPADNWAICLAPEDNGNDIVALPILNDGTEDLSRQPVYLTSFNDHTLSVDWPCVSPDGQRITFASYHGESEWIRVPDVSDVYLLKNVPAILAAPRKPGTKVSSLAPAGPDDKNIVPIRTSESVNFAHTPSFSQDGSLVIFSEDFNNRFQAARFFDVLSQCAFDVMVSNANGTGTDIRLGQSGNQAFVATTPGGVRITYGCESGGSMHLFMSSIKAITPVTGTQLADNNVQTTAPILALDGSGTVVSVPAGTTIDFPEGADRQIEVLTPVNPVDPSDLAAGVEAMPVVRHFGLAGTRLSPVATVTIAYTDAEVRGFDESGIRVFAYNSATRRYDEEITTGIVRDPAHNRISFPLDRFTTYGLGFTANPEPGK